MTSQAIVITLKLLDDRYNGADDWPPSPFRLFQALLCAANAGRAATDEERQALTWLEGLEQPVIAVPRACLTQGTTYYVPRNGADACGGNLVKAARLRDAKCVQPRLFEAASPMLYIWTAENADRYSLTISAISERLYQFGRGVDIAYATTELVQIEEAQMMLKKHVGNIYRPTPNGIEGLDVYCPATGSLNSLTRRHSEHARKFQGNALRQPAPPHFQKVKYNSPVTRLFFDFAPQNGATGYCVSPVDSVVSLVEQIRDRAAQRLKQHFPPEKIERLVIGRNASESDKNRRIRIIPLPSIGSSHADRHIRRLMVEVPIACPLATADIEWAFSGLNLGVDLQTGELLDETQPCLVSSDDRKMATHYGVDATVKKAHRIWRSVTPVALPIGRYHGKKGSERAAGEMVLRRTVQQAVRHSGYKQSVDIRAVQREPLEGKGLHAEQFAAGERFSSNTLYHVEIAFQEPVSGPLVIGNGRYLGLGIMAPLACERPWDVISYKLPEDNRPAIHNRNNLLHAMRRALMGRDRELNRNASRLFSGHESDGSAASTGRHEHVFLVAEDDDGDGRLDRVLIIAPWVADRNHTAPLWQQRKFEQVARGLRIVRAGSLGLFNLAEPVQVSADDGLFKSSKNWCSVTAYVPTRFPKGAKERYPQHIVADLLNECARRGLPTPDVTITNLIKEPRGRVAAYLQLNFSKKISGPIILGRTSHKGGGVFRVFA
ncbi:MAG: type I-U CRISPR-associated protein Cas5/Cas6 [Gammaproteobacteria bacterium]|nr:type I-U CRISPR-associated protein Cas5/Cas6 [Gammaproteobacteria bacterium]